MKHTLQLLVFYPFIFLLAYSVGSFSNASFDMTTWDTFILKVIGFVMGLVALAFMGFHISVFLEEMDKKTEKTETH